MQDIDTMIIYQLNTLSSNSYSLQFERNWKNSKYITNTNISYYDLYNKNSVNYIIFRNFATCFFFWFFSYSPILCQWIMVSLDDFFWSNSIYNKLMSRSPSRFYFYLAFMFGSERFGNVRVGFDLLCDR